MALLVQLFVRSGQNETYAKANKTPGLAKNVLASNIYKPISLLQQSVTWPIISKRFFHNSYMDFPVPRDHHRIAVRRYACLSDPR